MIATFFCITGLLVTRWISFRHLPLSDFYSSLLFLSWAFSIIHLFTLFSKIENHFSVSAAPSTMFTQGFATSGFLTEMHQSPTISSAHQSHCLMMHVSMMVLGYAALLCGSLSNLIVITGLVKRRIYEMPYFLLESDPEGNYFVRKTSFFSSKNYDQSQLIQQLDHWSYRRFSLGFLTIGIRAVWANETWGSYWNWDPKETWAFITWTIFAIIYHTRTNQNFEGSMVFSSIGYAILLDMLFWVNLLGMGLHSYGSFTLTSN
uniref:Putative cytochrome-c synthesis associated protein n=1 Tax=Cucumis sativus TaxID=3659 RepID=Q95DY2_CUCSA|nr:putative cytochrome-c synthesis associated protein [Cucumis sativus]